MFYQTHVHDVIRTDHSSEANHFILECILILKALSIFQIKIY